MVRVVELTRTSCFVIQPIRMVGAGAGVATSGSAGLGLAWRLVAQLVVAVASLSYIQLQPALINPLPSPLEPNILKSFLSPLIPYLLG